MFISYDDSLDDFFMPNALVVITDRCKCNYLKTTRTKSIDRRSLLKAVEILSIKDFKRG